MLLEYLNIAVIGVISAHLRKVIMKKEINLKKALKENFGHDEFKPGQQEIIQTLLDGNDVIAVLPTGAGKSMIYQLASQVLPGTTIVVSPLIALMKDQVDSLQELGHEVSLVNSTKAQDEIENEIKRAQKGKSKIMYVTPERFENKDFIEDLKKLEISLFVVDEAHCISEWGHDFRPSYLLLKYIIKDLNIPLKLALTATAPEHVRDEIIENLDLKKPKVIVHDIDRKNLFFEVFRVESEREDYSILEKLLFGKTENYLDSLNSDLDKCMKGCGIIYTATTKSAEETSEWLNSKNIPADFYHGKRNKKDKEIVQEKFMK